MKRRFRRLVLLSMTAILLSGVVLGGTAALHRSAGAKNRVLTTDEGLYCALRTGPLPAGSVIRVQAEDGPLIHTVAADGRGNALLGPLEGREVYWLEFPGGERGSFFLAQNGAVTALSGPVKDDGEILYYIVETEK